MGERYLIPTLYTRVSVRLTTPTQKSVSIDTSGNVVNLPDCTDLCNRFKIERVSMPSKLSVFQLRPFARSAWHYHRIVMHSNFLAGSIRFWMHPPVKMSPLLGICPQRYRQMWRHYIGFASRCVGCLCKCVGNRLSGSGNILSLLGKEKAQGTLKYGSALCCVLFSAGGWAGCSAAS